MYVDYSFDFERISNKLKLHIQTSNNKKRVYDIEVAQALNISKSYYSLAKRGERLPLEQILLYCAQHRININYLLFSQSKESLIDLIQE